MRPFRAARRLTRLHVPRVWAGFFFGDGTLELAVTDSTGAEISAQQRASATVPRAPGSDGKAIAPALRWQTAAEELRKQFAPSEHRIVTAIGCEDALCEMLQLPTTDPSELQQMLDLQIDNLSPLPTEEIVYGFEPLDVADGQSRVLVAIARKAAVNERVSALETAGLPTEIVTVDALAMFRALCQRQSVPIDDKLNAIVLLGTAAAHLVVYQQTQPVTVRSLLLGAEMLGTTEGRTAVREELQRTLIAAETTMPHCRRGLVTFVALHENADAAATALAGDCGLPSQCLRNGVVPSPALSLCLDGAVTADRPRLNLLPNEWLQRRRHARLRQHAIRGAIALAALYLAALAIFLTVLALRKTELRNLRNQVGSKQNQYADARQLHSELVAMQKQLDTKYSALAVLREASVLKPDGLTFNSFTFRKDQTLTLRGQAQSANTVNDFIGQMEKCALFYSVKTVSERTESGSGLTRFEILCNLQPAASGITSVPR
ncbi:MAG: pilus assembly protein PilM [Verrucomicrobiia bacterium]